jgi:4-amino-4-deoxy-L-arabinose transferase-like glycosyltransferase
MTELEADTTTLQPDREALEAENLALKRRVDDLEGRIAELQAELANLRGGSGYIDARARLEPTLLLVATLLLAAIPSGLVVADRWLEKRVAAPFLQELWCAEEFLCHLAYPPYFALILACFLGLLMLVALQKHETPIALTSVSTDEVADNATSEIGPRQSRISRIMLLGSVAGGVIIALRAVILDRLPGWGLALVFLTYLLGWFLREISIARVEDAWRRNQGWLVVVLIAYASLSVLLASYFGARRFQWVFALLLILAAINLSRHRQKISPIVWVVALAIILFSSNINAWWLSTIGDEYSFFFYAREIAEKQSVFFIGSHLFNGQAVYGTHPYFSSVIQAVFMKLFGSNSFGWRFSNAALSAVAIGFFYGFFKVFVSRRTALMASLFLAVSHYIMSFGKIGYNNLQAFFAMSLALWAAAWAVRTKRRLAFVTLGAALGLCFYVYPAALYVLPIPILLLLFYYPPTDQPAIQRWITMAMSLLILVFPLFLQPDYWGTKKAGTLFYNEQIVRTVGSLVSHLTTNFLYALLSFVYTPQEDHFIAVSYVDPLTAVFVAIGIACFLKTVRKERFSAFFLVSFATLLFLVGASHDRTYPTGTRMFLLLPWFALFAAVGLTWVLERTMAIGVMRGSMAGALVMIFLVVLGLNLYQAYPLARDRMAGFQSLETLFFRLVQRAQKDEAVAPKTYVFVTDPTWTSVGIQQIPDIYPVQARFVEVVVTDQNLPESARATIADKNALVIIKPWLEESWQKALEPPLRALGKVPCGIKTTTGDVRFTLWHSPELAWLCK